MSPKNKQEIILGLKKSFTNLNYKGINLKPGMLQEIYEYIIKKENQGHLIIRIFKSLRCLFFKDKSRIIGREKNKILTYYSAKRKDHYELFKKSLSSFKKEELIIMDHYFLKQKPIIKRISFNFPDLKLLLGIWKYFRKSGLNYLIKDRYFYFIMRTYFKCKQIDCVEGIIKKYNPQAYISLFPGDGREAILIQLFQKYGKPTFTIQHGILENPGEYKSGIENMFADYQLLWGEKSYNHAKKTIKRGNLIIVGNPKHTKIQKSWRKKFKPKKGVVFVSHDLFKRSNFEFIKIVNKFSEEYPDIKFYFKMHPTTPKKSMEEYNDKIKIKNFKIVDKTSLGNEQLKKMDFALIHGGSSVYFEMLKQQIPLFVYKNNSFPYAINNLGDTFRDYKSLKELLLKMSDKKKYKDCLKKYMQLYQKEFYQPRISIPDYYKKIINQKIKGYSLKEHYQ